MGSGAGLLVLIFLSACATQEPKLYPADWPALVTSSHCASLSGRYRNEASATTLWQSPYAPTARAYLGSLLSKGSPGTMAESQAAIELVILDASALTFSIVSREHDSPTPGPSTLTWSCLHTGELQLQYEFDSSGEDTIGKGKGMLTLRRDSSGSLIIRMDAKTRGVAFGVIPNGNSWRDWFRFDAL